MSLARGSLRQKTEEFSYALSGKMTEENRFVLQRILDRIDFLKKECSQIEEELFIRMKPYERQWHLLQTQCRFLKKNLLKSLDKSTRIRLVLFYTQPSTKE